MFRQRKIPFWLLLAGAACVWFSAVRPASAGVTLSTDDAGLQNCAGSSVPDQAPAPRVQNCDLPDLGGCARPETSTGGPTGPPAASIEAGQLLAPPLVCWGQFDQPQRWRSPELSCLAPPPRA